jgi:hypothetical protein
MRFGSIPPALVFPLAGSLACAGTVYHGTALTTPVTASANSNAPNAERDAVPARERDLGAPEGHDTLLVEVRLDGIDHRLTKALLLDAELHLPLRVVHELTGVRGQGDDSTAFISLTRLRALLGSPVAFDAADLVVIIQQSSVMPVVQRRRRDRERALFLAERPMTRATAAGASSTGVLTLDYDVLLTSGDQGLPSYRLRAGLGILGGELSWASGFGQEANEVAWTKWRPGSSILSHIELGSTRTGGALATAIRGLSLGNAPPFRPTVVGYRALTGRLGPGWTVDAYRGDRLLGFDSVSADGRFSLAMPLTYGENIIDLVAYGPRGERVALQEFLRFSPRMLPRGRFEYGASVGRCAGDVCTGAGSLEVRSGVTPDLTLSGGAYYERAHGASRLTPYGSLVALVGTDVGIEVDGFRDRLSRASVRFQPSPLAGVEALWLDLLSTSWLDGLSGYKSLSLDTWAALSRHAQATSVRAQLRYVADPRAPRYDVTLGTSHVIGGAHWRPYSRIQLGRDPSQSGRVGLETFVPPSTWLPAWLHGTWLRSLVEMDHGSGAVQRAEATVSRQLARDFRLETEAQWQRAVEGVALMVRVVTHTPNIRAIARGRRAGTSTQPGSWEYTVGGSIVADPRARRLAMSSEPSFNQGGVSVRAFVDLNDDGIRQPDESGAPDVSVLIGNRVAVTARDGRAHVWGLPAFEPILVRIDSQTVPAHWHLPSPLEVVPGSARTGHFELPLVPGSTLEGRLDSAIDIATIDLLLHEVNTARRMKVEVFRDGSFYLMSVRPGSYVLSATVNGAQHSISQVQILVPTSAHAQAPGRLAEVIVRIDATLPRAIPPCTGTRCRE